LVHKGKIRQVDTEVWKCRRLNLKVGKGGDRMKRKFGKKKEREIRKRKKKRKEKKKLYEVLFERQQNYCPLKEGHLVLQR